MIAVKPKLVFSTIPLKREGVVIVSPDQLYLLVTQNPACDVYVLWPEEKEVLTSLSSFASVFALGSDDHEEERRAAIEAGAKDYFVRDVVAAVSMQSKKEKDDPVIRLSPRGKHLNVNGISSQPLPTGINQPKVEVQGLAVEPKREELFLNFSRFDDLHRRPIGGRQTLVVTSTKGGIGKTTVAMNLARLLHDSGRGRVILVDFMHPHGNIAVRMKLKCEINVKTWETYFNRKVQLTDQQIMQQLVIKSPSGMYLLPSVDPGEECSPELIDYILANLNRVFDFVVVDIGPERRDLLTRVMTTATKTLLVVDYDLATIKDTLDYADVWHKRGLALEKVHVVVNFEPGKRDGNPLSREKCTDYLRSVQLNIIGFLPEAQGMRAIHNKGNLIVQEDPKHPFTRGLEGIVAKLIPDYVKPVKRSWFQRLLGK